jgi:hypothetical protein
MTETKVLVEKAVPNIAELRKTLLIFVDTDGNVACRPYANRKLSEAEKEAKAKMKAEERARKKAIRVADNSLIAERKNFLRKDVAEKKKLARSQISEANSKAYIDAEAKLANFMALSRSEQLEKVKGN